MQISLFQIHKIQLHPSNILFLTEQLLLLALFDYFDFLKYIVYILRLLIILVSSSHTCLLLVREIKIPKWKSILCSGAKVLLRFECVIEIQILNVI